MQQTKDQEWLLVDGGNLEVSVTREADAVEEAQRLRFDIFGREMGAGIHGENGRDIDHYDEFCRHLIVRDKTSSRIIGTYRLITEEAAKAAGGWYSTSPASATSCPKLWSWGAPAYIRTTAPAARFRCCGWA